MSARSTYNLLIPRHVDGHTTRAQPVAVLARRGDVEDVTGHERAHLVDDLPLVVAQRKAGVVEERAAVPLGVVAGAQLDRVLKKILFKFNNSFLCIQFIN